MKEMSKAPYEVKLFPKVGSFAEDKDIAREVRLKELMPLLKKNEDIILDFDKIDSTTQSFIHALISEIIRDFGSDVLDKISFKNCNENVQKIINIVVEYMQL